MKKEVFGMLRLKNKYGNCPPDGYRYVDPDTGHVTRREDYDSWLQAAAAHRRGNNLTIPLDFGAQMENQLCQILPAGWCDFDDESRPRIDTRFGLRDVWNWAEAHLKLLGDNFVPQEEAERRAKICSSCYMNMEGVGCAGCQRVATLFTAELAKRKTDSDQFLKSCGACKCYNRAQVHFPIAILETHDTDELQSMYPSFCWKKKSGENYHGA